MADSRIGEKQIACDEDLHTKFEQARQFDFVVDHSEDEHDKNRRSQLKQNRAFFGVRRLQIIERGNRGERKDDGNAAAARDRVRMLVPSVRDIDHSEHRKNPDAEFCQHQRERAGREHVADAGKKGHENLILKHN